MFLKKKKKQKHSSVLGIVCPLVCCGTCEVWCGHKGGQMLYPRKSCILPTSELKLIFSPPASQILQGNNKISLGL